MIYGLELPEAVVKYLDQLSDRLNPTPKVEQLISDLAKVMDDNAKTFEALKPVRDRALAKACELDIQAVPEISKERVLLVSDNEMKLAMKAGFPTIYGLKLVYEST